VEVDCLPNMKKILHQVKVMLTKARCLCIMTQKKRVTIQSDASDCGLGSILLQEGRDQWLIPPCDDTYNDGTHRSKKEMLAVYMDVQSLIDIFMAGQEVP
jgi:hypothetical protein